jgi:hypothetical protein
MPLSVAAPAPTCSPLPPLRPYPTCLPQIRRKRPGLRPPAAEFRQAIRGGPKFGENHPVWRPFSPNFESDAPAGIDSRSEVEGGTNELGEACRILDRHCPGDFVDHPTLETQSVSLPSISLERRPIEVPPHAVQLDRHLQRRPSEIEPSEQHAAVIEHGMLEPRRRKPPIGQEMIDQSTPLARWQLFITMSSFEQRPKPTTAVASAPCVADEAHPQAGPGDQTLAQSRLGGKFDPSQGHDGAEIDDGSLDSCDWYCRSDLSIDPIQLGGAMDTERHGGPAWFGYQHLDGGFGPTGQAPQGCSAAVRCHASNRQRAGQHLGPPAGGCGGGAVDTSVHPHPLTAVDPGLHLFAGHAQGSGLVK